MNTDTRYQLDIRRKELLGLCRRWQPSLQVIPSNGCQASWGPCPEELLTGDVELLATELHNTGEQHSMGCSDEEEEGSASFDSDIDDEESGEEDLVESIALSEIYDDVADVDG